MPKKDAAPEEAPAGIDAPEVQPQPEPAAVAQASTAEAPAKERLRTPAKWADVLFPSVAKGRLHPERWKHGAAHALHHWETAAHHLGRDFEISRADYESAISGALKSPPKPHEAALAPHRKGK